MFRTLKAVAEVNGWIPTVISFEPHSNYVLRGPGDPLLLTTTEEKREFVESLGMDFLVLPFTPEVAKLPFDEFVRTEQKFPSLDDLVRQIGMDADTARNYNSNHWAE